MQQCTTQRWILSMGSDIEVIEPVFLRKIIKNSIMQSHNTYQKLH